MTDAGGDKLVYNLYTDDSRTTVWGTWYSKTTKGASIDAPLGRPQKVTGSMPVYGRIAADQQHVAPGAYTATINKGNAAVSYGYASKGSCESFKHGDRVSVGVTVSATVRGGERRPAAITAPDASKPSPGQAAQVNTGQPDEKPDAETEGKRGVATATAKPRVKCQISQSKQRLISVETRRAGEVHRNAFLHDHRRRRQGKPAS
jgi:hypothetical protein